MGKLKKERNSFTELQVNSKILGRGTNIRGNVSDTS